MGRMVSWGVLWRSGMGIPLRSLRRLTCQSSVVLGCAKGTVRVDEILRGGIGLGMVGGRLTNVIGNASRRHL